MIPADVRKEIGEIVRKHRDAYDAAPKGAAKRIAGSASNALAEVLAVFDRHDAPERGAPCPNPDCEEGQVVEDYCSLCENPIYKTCESCQGTGKAPPAGETLELLGLEGAAGAPTGGER